VPHLEGDAHLHAGEVRAQAAVEAAGEPDVGVRLPLEIDLERVDEVLGKATA